MQQKEILILGAAGLFAWYMMRGAQAAPMRQATKRLDPATDRVITSGLTGYRAPATKPAYNAGATMDSATTRSQIEWELSNMGQPDFWI